MSIRVSLAGLAGFFLFAGMGLARAADVPVAEPTSHTYVSLEGGYVDLDGADVQAFLIGPEGDELEEHFLDISDGFYGRAEFGRVWDTGFFFNGIGVYGHGWVSNKGDTSETDFNAGLAYQPDGADSLQINTLGCSADGAPCSTGEADLDRSLFEVGVRFFHEFGDATNLSGLSLGVEPFVAFIDEDTSSTIGFTAGPFDPTSTRSSDLGATALGALLAFDARHGILERTVLIARIAAGAYYMDADADTDFTFLPAVSPTFSDGESSDFFGFRGQLAVGLEHMVTERLSLGVIGRLDYWSNFPSMEWTDATDFPSNGSDNSIVDEDFLALSIGARLSVHLWE
jgi:hypothetical protein